MGDPDAATCVGAAVAAARQKPNAVIKARVAERKAHTVASTPKP